VDDVIVFSKSKQHAQRLAHVLQRFEKVSLQLHTGKCAFAKPQVQHKGYVLSEKGVSASPDKVKAVREYRFPRMPGTSGHCWDLPRFTGGWYQNLLR
jgi:hypothetical protein